MRLAYSTKAGNSYIGDSVEILKDTQFDCLHHKIDLIFTSPPFPLNRKKSYGNLNGNHYVEWLSEFGPVFNELLAPDGSLVIELGNSWESGRPTMSLTPIEALIELKRAGKFYLCQEFIWHNPTKLPSPAQWVNVQRIRVKDAFTRLWWLSTTPYPKANNRFVLREYSSSMKELLKTKKYNSGKRPSQHRIGVNSFLTNNNGAIPSSVLSIPNTSAIDPYLDFCRKQEIPQHPSRMPLDLAKFFILFLTEKDDIVLDPFAGSNVTGFVAETCDRRWISIEKNEVYACSAISRFDRNSLTSKIEEGKIG
jgi:site-specific DNA-methyltransferase (cytosine-N4-specific)